MTDPNATPEAGEDAGDEADVADDLREGLRDLGLTRGDTVLVHSGLSGMACRPETLLSVFRDVLGEEGTLVVPTFTPTFRRESPDGVFDLQKTPSEVGYFTELVRSQPDARRNIDPTHSFAAIGGDAERFGRLRARNTYDRDNVLGTLHEDGAWVLAIGLERFGRSMTFFHYVEYQEGVRRRGWDYRVEKCFPGTIVVNGKAFATRHAIHVQNFERDVTYDFGPLGDVLDRRGHTRTASLADKQFTLWNAADGYDAIAETVLDTPKVVYSVGEE